MPVCVAFAFVFLNWLLSQPVNLLTSPPSPSQCQVVEVEWRREWPCGASEPAGADPSQQSCSGLSLPGDVGTPVIFLTGGGVGVKLQLFMCIF